MRGLESVKEKEKVIYITRNMIMTLKQENHIEITRVVDYALRYKRRKDPTAFIDSILFPTLEQAGSIVRFYMYYLGKDMLAAIGMWDIDENPALDSPPQEKNQEDKKAKKKPKASKKKHKKTSLGKGHNPTTRTSENEDYISEFGSKDKRSDGAGLFDSKVEAEIEMMKWDRITDIGDDSWIPVDEKKRKQISNRPPKPMATKDSTKSSAYRSDAENKKTLSSKKSKKKSISQARSVNSEGRSEEKIGAEIDSKRDNLIENGKLLDIDGISDDRNTRDYQYVMKVKPKQSIESNYFEYKVKDLGSQKSDSNPEVQSSLGSLETESIGISTDYKKSTTIDGGSQKVENSKAPKQSKLRGPCQSKPFIHFEAQNELNLNGILKSPGPLALFSTPVVTIEKPGLFQSKLITTMSDSDKKLFIYLNKSIGSLLAEVDQYSSRMKQIYAILLERTKKVIKHVFPGKNNLDAVVYGSFDTDLLVAYSDMDVCITGFDSMNRSQALEILKTLSEKMEMFEWCSEIKYISGATVPVVKIVKKNNLDSRLFCVLR